MYDADTHQGGEGVLGSSESQLRTEQRREHVADGEQSVTPYPGYIDMTSCCPVRRNDVMSLIQPS